MIKNLVNIILCKTLPHVEVNMWIETREIYYQRLGEWWE